MKKIARLEACTRPLTGSEIKAISFVDAVENKIKINGRAIDAVFRGGQILVHPKAVTI